MIGADKPAALDLPKAQLHSPMSAFIFDRAEVPIAGSKDRERKAGYVDADRAITREVASRRYRVPEIQQAHRLAIVPAFIQDRELLPHSSTFFRAQGVAILREGAEPCEVGREAAGNRVKAR